MNKIILSVLFLLATFNSIVAQNLCGTPSSSTNSYLNKSYMMRRTLNNNSYCLKVYFHVIRTSNGTGGQTVAAVNQGFQILNQDYNPHNISFKWDNVIDYINNSSYYTNPSAAIFSVNNHSDGIDIYLFDDSSSGNGLANGVGSSSEFYVSGSFWNPPYNSLITSHVISHEMGHVLFLWHTHHGVEAGSCPELVNGSNASTCGDFVVDTPADPHIQFNVNPANCTWLGSGSDANGQSYNPDTHNIMAYTIPACMSYFTPLQGLRMRNAISSLPFLMQTVVSNCLSCDTQSNLDLYVKDSQADTGTEPNTVTQYMWTSENIWVRNYADNGLTHQNPDYSANGNPNYVYVRVKNKSCTASTGNEQLKVYWAKAGTSLSWPTNWNGSTFPTGQLLGQNYGTVNIPVLQAGQEVILQFPWVVPNPNDYTSINSEPWHFCLLARVEASNDPMAVAETSDLNSNVRNNNNIAWKNVTVVDVLANNFSGVVSVGNPYNHPHTFFLELVKEDLETGKPIFEEAEVGLKMDQTLYNAWERGGKAAQLLDATLDEKRKVVKGNNVILDNIAFNPNEIGTLNVSFNFLTKELTDKTKFVYHVIQKDAITGAVVGGETYVINKEPRTLFVADAGGDKEVDKNEPITISASQISEPAIYNWYDSNGNLVFSGKDLTIATEVATKYKLEVIATADGFKDYSEVEVNLKPSVLNTIAPNPATNNVTIGYKLNEVGSAYLMIIGGYGTTGTSNNYILDTNNTETNINISNYPNGFYTVVLVCNGQIVDAKTLIKQ